MHQTLTYFKDHHMLADKTMTFYDWMLKKYDGKDTPRGDLSNDNMKKDKAFTQRNTRDAILDYLYFFDAFPEV